MDNNNRAYNTNFIPLHTHNSVDGSPLLDGRYSLVNTIYFFQNRIVANGTNTAVANVVGGDFVMPFNGFFAEIGATVDTAGVTGNTTIDVNNNGNTIMSTKITINTATKSSRVATAPALITPSLSGFSKGDIITFDIDAVSTTAAKGLTIFMTLIKTQAAV